MDNDAPLFIIGDIHGHLEKMIRLLRFANLANSKAEWVGGAAQLWFMGDFTDRGPDGIGTLDFVMRLQADAAQKDARVGALLGNHDVGLLSAHLWRDQRSGGPGGTFYKDWAKNGGLDSDLARLETRHIEWIQQLPAMACVNERLLVHADALFYLNYGETIQAVNETLARVLQGGAAEYDRLLVYGGDRFAFTEKNAGGVTRARQFLKQFGGKQIIHGHTPIPVMNGEPYDRVTRAYVYADGLAVNVDGGIYKGGVGFVYEAAPLT